MSTAQKYFITVRCDTALLSRVAENIVRILASYEPDIAGVTVRSDQEMDVLISSFSLEAAHARVSRAVGLALEAAGATVIPGISFETREWVADVAGGTAEGMADDLADIGFGSLFIIITAIFFIAVIKLR